MKIIVVDNEKPALNNFVETLQRVQSDSEIFAFLNTEKALECMAADKIDVAFLDIEMGKISGIDFAEECKKMQPHINVIFVTGYSQYSMDAFKLHASGYLMKPVRADDLRFELENLRHPLEQTRYRVRIQTFGNFEIFVDGDRLKFPRSKCKECLAYLVDRKGAGVTFAQLSSVLWEDSPNNRRLQNHTHRVISDLVKVLKEKGISDMLLRSRRDLAIDVSGIDCDYFRALGGDPSWVNAFTGEYMTNYSWGEFTLGELIENKRRLNLV